MTLIEKLEERKVELESESRTCMITDGIDPEKYLAQARAFEEAINIVKDFVHENVAINHDCTVSGKLLTGESKEMFLQCSTNKKK